MEFRILGPLEVAEGGQPVDLGVPKQRALLAVLLLHANEVVSSERLVDELWGESPPARAAKLVQHYVSGLRKVLPAGALLTRAPGYLLRVEPGRLDLFELERLLDEARRAAADGDLVRGADRFRHALSLWRGRALEGVALEGHAAREAAGLDDVRLATLIERIELDLELGRHAELVAELETLVVGHPYQERLRGQLMLALYRSGRQAEALDAYHAARRTLRDELGLEPSHELQRLERAILQQDPALDPPAPEGSEAAGAPVAEPRRKTVTVLACKLASPPADPEALRNASLEVFGGLRAAAERHGAVAERLPGGELIAVFGVPAAHEDDALRALRAASSLRGDRLRIGVVTGEVVAEGATLTGETVAAAIALAGEAAPGEVLAAEATQRLAGAAARFEGRRAVAVAEGGPAFPERTEAPLIGRSREVAGLRALLDSVVAARRCRVTTVFGEAGIGKTRLARELVAAAAGTASVLVGRCVPYGEGATYLPLREALRGLDVAGALAGTGEAELVAQRLAELTGEAEGAGSSGEGFWAVRQLLEALGRERPLLLVLEDLHWAEDTFLDLVEYLAEWSTESPVLVLCLARPELADRRPAWGGATSPIGSLALEPLSREDSATLVGALAGGLSAETRASIAETAEGNPLYVEQLAAYAEDAGAAALAAVPPTIEALLAGRLDALPPDERATLEHAAVVGRELRLAAVVDLAAPDEAGATGRHLLALARRGLLRPDGEEFRFHHVLIRDVAYAALPKQARAELHERHSDWLEHHDDDDALIGYHLEQAYRLRAELGETDGRARRLAEGAGRRLGAAGLRAFKLGDIPATLNLLERATSLLPQRDARRLELLVELAVTRWAAGDAAAAEDTLAETIAAAQALRDRRAELRARMELANVRLFTDPEGRGDEVLEAAALAIPVFEELGDDRSLGVAFHLSAYVHGAARRRYGRAEALAERALHHYRRAGWPVSACLWQLGAAAYFGPQPVPDAIARCTGLLPDADRRGQAHLLAFLGGLRAFEGDFDEARELLAGSRAAYDDLGDRRSIAANCARILGECELLAGDSAAAERALTAACETLESMHEHAPLATQAGVLARALLELGRNDEAWAWTRRAEEIAASDDSSAQIGWRMPRARLLARRGGIEEALQVAREAVELAERTDALNDHANALLVLAAVLRRAGSHDEAAARLAAAVALFERKGNVVASRAARDLVEELAIG